MLLDEPFEPSRHDLIALIDWLALPYAGDPVFIMEGENATEHKQRLKATWEHVVGTKGSPIEGVWAQCRTCGQWQVVHPQALEAISG